jgi:hypothetical protein
MHGVVIRAGKGEGEISLLGMALGGFVGIICSLPSSIHAANSRFDAGGQGSLGERGQVVITGLAGGLRAGAPTFRACWRKLA